MERKCWDCGNVAEHNDNIVPHVLCKKCGSQDTRLTRTEERDRDLKQLNEQLCGFWKQLKALEMAKQLARHWVIEHHLRTGHLPNNSTFYSYPIGWGEADNGPMHGKRVVITLTIENEARS